jgi:hypothetical protein
VIAYKCLRPGAIGPFSGFRWPVPAGPEPGPWVLAEPGRCASGIHACTPEQLPYWLNWELWRVELGGPVTRAETKVVAERGRLVARLDGWSRELRDAFRSACAARVLALDGDGETLDGYRRDARTFLDANEPPAMLALLAARAAQASGGSRARDAERGWQAEWLADRLPLLD